MQTKTMNGKKMERFGYRYEHANAMQIATDLQDFGAIALQGDGWEVWIEDGAWR